MNTHSINEAEIRNLEFTYRDAVKAGDVATIQKLTADPCIVVGGEGVMSVDRQALTEMMNSGDFTLKRYQLDPDEDEFRELAANVALLTYRVREDYERGGRPGVADSYNASVWVRRGDAWECAVHSESMIQRPS